MFLNACSLKQCFADNRFRYSLHMDSSSNLVPQMIETHKSSCLAKHCFVDDGVSVQCSKLHNMYTTNALSSQFDATNADQCQSPGAWCRYLFIFSCGVFKSGSYPSRNSYSPYSLLILSASFLAEISDSSPEKLCIFVISKKPFLDQSIQ